MSTLSFSPSFYLLTIDSLTSTLKAHGNKGPREVYPASKFVQLLGALYWKRQLAETSCSLVAVSPGLIPDTGLGRNHPEAKLSMSMPDAKTVEVGKSLDVLISNLQITLFSIKLVLIFPLTNPRRSITYTSLHGIGHPNREEQNIPHKLG